MTGAEKVQKWIQRFYEVHGQMPTPEEIVVQLDMAIDEEKEKFNLITF